MPARRRMVVGAVETVLSTQVELYNSPLIGENACRWRWLRPFRRTGC